MKSLKELDLSDKKYIIFDMDGTLIDSIGIWNEADFRIVNRFAGLQVDLEILQRNRDSFLETHSNMVNAISFYDTFDLIIRKEDVQHKKPHPEVYLKVLEYYHANPEECLVFEDSLHGVMASKSAGIDTINVYDKYSDKDRLKIDSLVDYKIDSYLEFMNILRGGKNYEYTKRNNEGL